MRKLTYIRWLEGCIGTLLNKDTKIEHPNAEHHKPVDMAILITDTGLESVSPDEQNAHATTGVLNSSMGDEAQACNSAKLKSELWSTKPEIGILNSRQLKLKQIKENSYTSR